MFDFSATRQAWIPVQWPGLQPDGDNLAKPVQHEIECLVEFLDKEELESLGAVDTGDGLVRVGEAAQDKSFFDRVVKDWRKVADKGVSVPMTPENVTRMLKVPMFAGGFAMSYLRAWAGVPEVREKNSEGGPVNGQADEPTK